MSILCRNSPAVAVTPRVPGAIAHVPHGKKRATERNSFRRRQYTGQHRMATFLRYTICMFRRPREMQFRNDSEHKSSAMVFAIYTPS